LCLKVSVCAIVSVYVCGEGGLESKIKRYEEVMWVNPYECRNE